MKRGVKGLELSPVFTAASTFQGAALGGNNQLSFGFSRERRRALTDGSVEVFRLPFSKVPLLPWLYHYW